LCFFSFSILKNLYEGIVAVPVAVPVLPIINIGKSDKRQFRLSGQNAARLPNE
jgi:hypothetical protein